MRQKPFVNSVIPVEVSVLKVFSINRYDASLSLDLYAVAQMFAGPRASGTWVGFQNALGNLSGIIGPVITGVVIHRAGWDSAFILTAAIAAFGAAWWAFGVPKIEQVDLGEEQPQRS